MAGSELTGAQAANSILCHLNVFLADNTLKNILKSAVELKRSEPQRAAEPAAELARRSSGLPWLKECSSTYGEKLRT